MTILNFPVLSIANPPGLEFGLVSNTQVSESPLSGSVQTTELPGAKWLASWSYNSLSEDDAALLQAFLVQLRGQARRFYLHNFARPQPRGTAAGTPLVNGAGQVGASLVTDGWAANQTVLKAGDFVGVNGELKMVPADVLSNGSGQATIPIEPPLRATPADNTPIILDKPKCVMMMTTSRAVWLTKNRLRSDFSFECVEDF